MTVPDPALEELKPCNEEVKSYLAVDYHCVPGMAFPIENLKSKLIVIVKCNSRLSTTTRL